MRPAREWKEVCFQQIHLPDSLCHRPAFTNGRFDEIVNRIMSLICLVVGTASALTLPSRAVMAPRAAVRMQQTEGWQLVVENARGRASAVKADQDATTAAMVTGGGLFFLLPVVDNVVADLLLSTIIAGLLGFTGGFVEGPAGDVVRKVGGVVSGGAGQVSSKLEESGVLDKLPGGGGKGLSYSDIKKYGVAGTLAYILTELAFWAVAFPVASTTFYNTAGHWPDFSNGDDRTAVLAFIFAGANVARLVVPLRFGAAFALIPWVDENIVQKVRDWRSNSVLVSARSSNVPCSILRSSSSAWAKATRPPSELQIIPGDT